MAVIERIIVSTMVNERSFSAESLFDFFSRLKLSFFVSSLLDLRKILQTKMWTGTVKLCVKYRMWKCFRKEKVLSVPYWFTSSWYWFMSWSMKSHDTVKFAMIPTAWDSAAKMQWPAPRSSYGITSMEVNFLTRSPTRSSKFYSAIRRLVLWFQLILLVISSFRRWD